ncbi:glycoside-pentoside-hexuronide (GPH):cation symporter [Enterococcus sp. LJL120]
MQVTTDEKMISEKVPISSKFAYGLGDASSTILNIFLVTYLTYFYTDILKISLATVGTLLLTVRIVEALCNPVIGVLVDKTNTKWGKCRPWFLGDAIPLGIFFILNFTAPDVSASLKMVLAYIFYIGYSFCSASLNVPLISILSSMTSDPQERTAVNSWRMAGGQIAGAVSSVITIPLVLFFGKGDEGRGYFLTAAVYGTFAAVCALLCFFNIKEKNQQTKEVVMEDSKEKISVVKSFIALKNNWPLFICIAVNLINAISTTLKNSGAIYYLKYQIGSVELMSVLLLMNYAALLSILIVPRLNKIFSKRNCVIIGMLFNLLGQILVFFSSQFLPFLFIGSFISNFGNGFLMGLLYSMIADCVDYGQWKNGVRSQGLISSLSTFGEKLGTGLGGALASLILAIGGYVAGSVQQTGQALTAISTTYVIAPLIMTALCCIIMTFYNLDKKYPQIIEELKTYK